MVVDDDPDVRSQHERLLSALGYEVEVAADGVEALAKLALGVDLVLLDEEMPHLDGFEVARRIRESPDYETLPIIMATGLTGRTMHRRAREVGINDFLPKPVDADELGMRARWLLQLKHARDQLKARGDDLERLVAERTAALRKALELRAGAERRVYGAHLDTIHRLAVAAEFKDRDTGGHIERVGLFSGVLATALDLPSGLVEVIRHAAPMHDVGKIGIPDEILLKPGQLNEREWDVMRKHTTLGARLLEGSDSDVLQVGARIARSHHERWDGAGYPAGLAGEEIPVEARICAVVDFYDAVTMARPYRPALTEEYAIEQIDSDAAAHFDPVVKNAFLECLPDLQNAMGESEQTRSHRMRLPESLDKAD